MGHDAMEDCRDLLKVLRYICAEEREDQVWDLLTHCPGAVVTYDKI